MEHMFVTKDYLHGEKMVAIVSYSEPDYRNLNKKDIEDGYVFAMYLMAILEKCSTCKRFSQHRSDEEAYHTMKDASDRDFHEMDDAKEDLGSSGYSEGLEKGYDRFQQLLSQLEAHGAEVCKLRMQIISFSNLFPQLVKYGMSMRTNQMLTFVHCDGITNKVKSGNNGAFNTYYSSLQTIFKKEMFLWSLLKLYKRLEEESGIDGNKPVGFDKKKLECFKCHNTGHFTSECTSKGTNDGKKRDSFYQDQGTRKKEQNQNCLLIMDDGVVNWGEHTVEEEEINHALMAISSHNEQQLSLNEQLTFQANEIYAKYEKLKKYRRIGMKDVKEKEQLQKIVDSWKDSSKNRWKLVNSGMSSNSNVGLGYGIKSNNEVLSYEEEMNRTVFNCTEEDFVEQNICVQDYQKSCNICESVDNSTKHSTSVNQMTVKDLVEIPLSTLLNLDSQYLPGPQTALVLKDHREIGALLLRLHQVIIEELRPPPMVIDHTQEHEDSGIIVSGCSEAHDCVSFVKELGHFNLFSISQICDKKHKVLFTEIEYLVVSLDYKMPDENQILLKVPRQNNMYSFDMKTPGLTKDYACLIAKSTSDESKLWHREVRKPNVKGVGYRWMFDIDYLTDSMNYIPVSLENQAKPHAGTSAVTNHAGTSEVTNSAGTPNTNASEEEDGLGCLMLFNFKSPSVSQEKEAFSTGILEDTPEILALRRDLDQLAQKYLREVTSDKATSLNSVNSGSEPANTQPADQDDSDMPELTIFN
ncbi:ribonuclease H-like domain-containing protein [Tanacetum coccineum]